MDAPLLLKLAGVGFEVLSVLPWKPSRRQFTTPQKGTLRFFLCMVCSSSRVLLRVNCAEIEAFNSTVHSLVEVLSTQAEAIEKEKLRAIGARNLAEAEPENRDRRKKEIRALVAEKRAALDRCVCCCFRSIAVPSYLPDCCVRVARPSHSLRRQYESLEKVEAEQRALIEKLSNNEA